MDSQKEQHLSNLLTTIRAGNQPNPDPPHQPSRHFKELPDDQEPMSFEQSSRYFHSPMEFNSEFAHMADKSAPSTSKRLPGKMQHRDADADEENDSDSGGSVDSDWFKSAEEAERRSLPESAEAATADVDAGDGEGEEDDGDDGEEDAADEDGESEGYEEEEEEEEGEENAPASQVSELYRYNETESDFIAEFRAHNEENRQSLERLSGQFLRLFSQCEVFFSSRVCFDMHALSY